MIGEALETFVEEAQGLSASFESAAVFSIGGWGVSQYIVYVAIAFMLTLAVVLISSRKLQLIPTNKFYNTVELGYDFVKKNIGEDVIHEGFKQHVPFLATLFFFILIANVVGLIPGAKAMAGSLSVTWGLSCVSFVYFIVWGIRTSGVLGYVKSLCPHGVPAPMVPIIWVLELISTLIRVLTLAVRLYGNMLAGHMVLAVFSLATTVFLQTAVLNMDFVTALPAIAWFALLVAMYALECLVAFLQAYVFAILSASYISMAVHPH